MPPRVLAWSPQRGCVTEPDEFALAVRAGELLLHVDDDQIMRGIEGDAPLVAVVRADSAAHQLARKVADLHARIDDLHVRMVDAAEGALEDPIRKR